MTKRTSARLLLLSLGVVAALGASSSISMILIQTGDEDRLWEKNVNGSSRRAVKDKTFGTSGLESMNLFLRLLSCFQDPRFGRAVSPRNIVPPRLLNHSYQTAARDFGLERLFGAVVSDSGPAAMSTASATPVDGLLFYDVIHGRQRGLLLRTRALHSLDQVTVHWAFR
ncbi:hypothetical protein PF008_g29846 [Phytophthora fragariae]|uniref:RxLR effector protein n=1 Tax=Phytophthora fragariae TaxID=53985 RepID=A0A6G0Q7A0_9STRA|nr:hypothetical protein PF008_g29846 [Phytophthora fragariae]